MWRGRQEKGCHPRTMLCIPPPPHPSSPSVPGHALRGVGGSAERGRGQGEEATCSPHRPLPAPGEARRSLLLWGAPGTHRGLPTPPHHRLPPPSCSPRLSPTTRGASQLHNPRSPGLQTLSPVHCPYEIPPMPHAPAPLPAVPPVPWLQHTGQVAAEIQAWQHAAALPPAWHERDRAAAARGRQCRESEQQSRAGTFAQDGADGSGLLHAPSQALQEVAAAG